MRKYKKAFLTTVLLSSMSLIASTNGEMIQVTTFDDEYGENPNTCSLREALEAARLRTSFGGCIIKTGFLTSNSNHIQLKAGEYILKKELVPQVNVVIWGESPVNWNEQNILINDVVNQYPALTSLKTTIKAENSRIFNTAFSQKSLNLNNLILTGGRTASIGGAIYAGADVVLNRSHILNSDAGQAGGAIYLSANATKLAISNSLIQGNRAPIGSVLAMNDFNDNLYISRDINIQFSSIVNNGSDISKSMFEFMGKPSVLFESNTISQNNADLSHGNLIKFTGDTDVGSGQNNRNSILSDKSALLLKNNTIVENNAYTTFLYDKIGQKVLNFNVIAYNGGVGTYACRYLLGSAKEEKLVGLVANYNAFARSGTNFCDFPDEVFKTDATKENNIDITGKLITDLLSPRVEASSYTAFLPLYYPKNNRANTDEKVITLVDTGANTNCSDFDQRGLARKVDRIVDDSSALKNTCDIGSVELMKLTARDFPDLSNSSISQMIDSYQIEYDRYDELVKKPNNVDFVPYYKFRAEQYKKKLNVFNNPETRKNALKYRAIYVDLWDTLPQEVRRDDGAHALEFFDPNLYKVNVETLGTGLTKDQLKTDENLFCKWNEDLEQIMIYRIDDLITQSGDKAFCKYTITSISDQSVTSSGLLQAEFNNIKPVVTDTSVTLKYKQSETATLNLLDFANDDGDTGKNGSGPQLKPNKPAFWRNAEGIELPIRLSNVSSNLIITADREGNCPAPDQQEKCYGGNIYIKEANAFNPFNFSFNYQVYDNDQTPAISNVGTVKVISTATTTDDTRNAKSGGGSTTLLSLFGLLGLLAYRRFRK
ncbi:CSLREA domain-containing protein [Acinetobacter haemolyticus]|uniref:CSLREA domain-containing protein n=1 Tax=Acinetobacter haemolyticus TaxID=29430 RepID=UPI000DEBD8C1|nr:CSLREA domain-containing protein [Acinetobacter haemolyticus]